MPIPPSRKRYRLAGLTALIHPGNLAFIAALRRIDTRSASARVQGRVR